MNEDYALDPVEQAKAARRLNVGSGPVPLYYWTNLDRDHRVPADLHVSVPPLPYGDGTLDEIYAGHFLEHLSPGEARWFLAECWRCLSSGGRLGVMVPDTRAVMRAYVMQNAPMMEWPVAGEWHDLNDLDELCSLIIYSTAQETPHKWSYDLTTLQRLLERAGFTTLGEINRYDDPRVVVPAWYQCGLDVKKVV